MTDKTTMRIGILGAAGITPSALIEPAANNPDVEVVVVAARNRARAEEFAAAHGVARVVDNYEAVVTDPEVDAVYIPLPNSHHSEWTVAAIRAGKHVLVEKPFASNADEAREVAAVADGSDVVVMEAFHYRYHPLVKQAVALVAEGAIGDVVEASATFDVVLPDRSDIRYQFDLAGGSLMDLGCYPLHLLRSVLGCEPTVTSATARPADHPLVDEAMEAELDFDGVPARLHCSLLEQAEVQHAFFRGTLGTLEIEGYVKPQGGNRLTFTVDGNETTTEAPVPPTSYEAQLQVFVAAVRAGHPVLTGPADSVAMMEAIDAIYDAAGLGQR